MQKKWMIPAALSAVALALTGCTAAGGDSGKTEISFLVFETPNLTAEFWDQAIGRFEEAHPDIVVNKIVSPDADRNKYAQTLLSTGQFPDVQIALSPSAFVDAGALQPFAAEDLTDFTQPMSGAINGEQYQLPWVAQGIPLMYYNKDLFAQAGVTEAPATWDDLLAASEKLKAAGINPIQLGGSGADAWASAVLLDSIVSADVYGEDPDWILKRYAGDVSFQDPEFVAALDKFKTVIDSGFTNSDALSLSYAQLQEAFLAGKSAMYPMGTWFAAAGADASFDLGVFAIPSPTDVIPVFTGGGLTISAASAHPEAALTFAKAFSLDQENLTAFLRSDATFPAVKGYVLPDDVSQIFRESYDITMNATNAVGPFAWEAGDRSLPAGVPDALYAAAQSIMTGGSVADAAASLDAKWDEVTAG